jgi:hypothetical protein
MSSDNNQRHATACIQEYLNPWQNHIIFFLRQYQPFRPASIITTESVQSITSTKPSFKLVEDWLFLFYDHHGIFFGRGYLKNVVGLLYILLKAWISGYVQVCWDYWSIWIYWVPCIQLKKGIMWYLRLSGFSGIYCLSVKIGISGQIPGVL